MRHLYFNLKDLFSNRKSLFILTSLLRFKNKSREFREQCRITNCYLYISSEIIYVLTRWFSDDIIWLYCQYQHVETGSKQSHLSMNRMTTLIIQYLLCVLPMGKILHFCSKFDQDLSLYCGSVKPKFQTRPGDRFLWVFWVMISKFNWQFSHSFSKNTFESSYNFYPIDTTWRKWYVQFVWNQCQWKRDVCIHYDVSLYQRIHTDGKSYLNK